MNLAEIEQQLVATYGPDFTKIAPDGNEDEFGDLIADTFAALTGVDGLDHDLWDHFDDVACCSRATTYTAWLAELAAVVDIYGREPS